MILDGILSPFSAPYVGIMGCLAAFSHSSYEWKSISHWEAQAIEIWKCELARRGVLLDRLFNQMFLLYSIGDRCVHKHRVHKIKNRFRSRRFLAACWLSHRPGAFRHLVVGSSPCQTEEVPTAKLFLVSVRESDWSLFNPFHISFYTSDDPNVTIQIWVPKILPGCGTPGLRSRASSPNWCGRAPTPQPRWPESARATRWPWWTWPTPGIASGILKLQTWCRPTISMCICTYRYIYIYVCVYRYRYICVIMCIYGYVFIVGHGMEHWHFCSWDKLISFNIIRLNGFRSRTRLSSGISPFFLPRNSTALGVASFIMPGVVRREAFGRAIQKVPETWDTDV